MLDGNVGPCSGPGPALTIDQASLDLKGFVVSCAAEIDGIVLLGHGARVKNGTVTACGRGIVPGGSGEHVVRNVTAQSSDYGFWVEEGSDSNKLHANTAQRNSNCR